MRRMMVVAAIVLAIPALGTAMPIVDGFRVAAEVAPNSFGFVPTPTISRGPSILSRGGYDGLTAADVARLFAGYQAGAVAIDRVHVVLVEPASPGRSVPLPENFAWANAAFVAESASTDTPHAAANLARARQAAAFLGSAWPGAGGLAATFGQPAAILGDLPAAQRTADGLRPAANIDGRRGAGVGNSEAIRSPSASSNEGPGNTTGAGVASPGSLEAGNSGRVSSDRPPSGNPVGRGEAGGGISNGPGTGFAEPGQGSVVSIPTPPSLLLAFAGLLGMLALCRPRQPR